LFDSSHELNHLRTSFNSKIRIGFNPSSKIGSDFGNPNQDFVLNFS
jgi:hypothetical protein